MQNKTVFISYAREDSSRAERLYMDLRKADIDAWLDTKCLLPGQNWKKEISKAIKNSAFFLALISERSVNKRGVVQKELKQALEIIKEIPSHHIFLIPVRLDLTTPVDEELQDLNWVDLFPSYEKGIQRILGVLESLEKDPLEIRNANTLGIRAPIHYTPYRSYNGFIKDFVSKLPDASMFADTDYAVYITYRTTHPAVKMPEYLKMKYPEEITIVLQHIFKDLKVENDCFSVKLSFNGKGEILKIPYEATKEVAIPAIGIKVQKFI